MPRNGNGLALNLQNDLENLTNSRKRTRQELPVPGLVWDWDIEHGDRKQERKADSDATLRGATPFEVDRRVLRDIVHEKMGVEVGRIKFLSAGTFHKAYLITLVDHEEVVARVARRMMPRLKVESEVATMQYLREKTNVPVPIVYHYDSNPYNRLGGEFILMSKAPGIPLAEVFHSLSYKELTKLVKNVARLTIPLFAHRFSQIGSLYSGSPSQSALSSGIPTPKASFHNAAYPFSTIQARSAIPAALTPGSPAASLSITPTPSNPHSGTELHIGPIVSWPFFGSNRGFLSHPNELNRGPWSTTHSYLSSCVGREIQGVISENEGRSAPHRLHLDPHEVISSRHHHLNVVPGDESDGSDEYDLEESEEEWEGPGDVMYRDYRRMQRSTFLFTHMAQREKRVGEGMTRWMGVMEKLIKIVERGEEGDKSEEFGIDCHDLSLENIFVDEIDHTKVTCIIDWESTTTRPLWQCAHLPAFIQSSPFVAKLFRHAVTQLPNDPSVKLPPSSAHQSVESLCREWLYYESAGMRLRMAHRCGEWDGWEEGLVESILGPVELEEEWFKFDPRSPSIQKLGSHDSTSSSESSWSRRSSLSSISLGGAKVSSKLPFVDEQKKEQMLNTTGDICGGRGGELGRRLEAWLSVNAQNDGGGGCGGGGNGGGGGRAIGVVGGVLNKERWLEGQRTVVALDL
ncbi:Altered inheritance of mitochondria protein 9, mitochondrial [Leucoagaricus sp. SymC.cos]|nr:Altered inheritance of mitochondria protein 9, mitochondrial [Leucoagaricus sp. SymC.cos]